MIDWRLLEKNLTDKASLSEKKQFKEWLNESDKHRLFYEQVLSGCSHDISEERLSEWRNEFIQKLQFKKRYVVIRRFQMWGSVAAVVLISIIVGYVWRVNLTEQHVETEYVTYQEPDRDRVHLLTSSGVFVDLSKLQLEDTLVIDGSSFRRDGKGFIHEQNSKTTSEHIQKYNELYVPRGAEFSLTLSDGSRVWLNSDTKLKFPTHFSGQKREVELSGEAYFDVKKNERKPFIVRINEVEVTVLGTEFNINSRSLEEIQTTLVEGVVKVCVSHGETTILKPGEMASANVYSKGINVSTVYVPRYTAWHQGNFYFENATMEELLEELSLWYDIKITYLNDLLRKERFSGHLKRSDSISDILSKLERTTYVHFSIEGNNIIVRY